jgi:hypothetical protein
VIALRTWSLSNVLTASVLWVVLIVGLVAAYIYIQFRRQTSAGSAGVGAVSVSGGISELVVAVLVLFGPPLLLALIWFYLRRS